MCLGADRTYFVVTRPGSVFVQPANWIHAVFTVHADPAAIHTGLEIVHLPSVKRVVEKIIPLIVNNLRQHNAAPDEEWVDDILKVLWPDRNLKKVMPQKSIDSLTELVESVHIKPI